MTRYLASVVVSVVIVAGCVALLIHARMSDVSVRP